MFAAESAKAASLAPDVAEEPVAEPQPRPGRGLATRGDDTASPEPKGDAETSFSGRSEQEDSALEVTTATTTTQELREEVETLEETVEKLFAEKKALRMRLDEVHYYQKFQVADCKRWLQSNYDFDRKDSAALLAGIFEDYLLHNDELEPLPHQLIVKNSTRAQNRRQKQHQSELAAVRGVKRQVADSPDAPPSAKKQNAEFRRPVSTRADHQLYNVYVAPAYIDRLYNQEPWKALECRGGKTPSSPKGGAVQDVLRSQEEFLTRHAIAIWERGHWFPMKPNMGHNAAEAKAIGFRNNRRKRRQHNLKVMLEEMSAELQQTVSKAVLKRTIFSVGSVEAMLSRPKLWVPRENEELVPQLKQLDKAEPERNHITLV